MTINEALTAISGAVVDNSNATTALVNYLTANPPNPDVGGQVQPLIDQLTASTTTLKGLIPAPVVPVPAPAV